LSHFSNFNEKMKKFPLLNKNQVVLVRAEVKSGHVLDEDFNLKLNDDQQVYTIFNSLTEALDMVALLLLKRNDIEYIIYGEDGEVLKYIDPLQQ
jgi:hypothetical protein